MFEACNPDKEGFISLHNFANIGRMYAGRDQVDRVVGMLKPTNKDKINFDEFCLSLSTLIEQDSEGEDSEKENTQPTFKENVDKSWLKQKREKEIEEKELNERRRKKREENEKNYVRRDEGSSDNEEGQQQILGAKLVSPKDPRKKMKKKFSSSNMHRRQSQTRLTGAIPLVNTSSEDDNDLEDSFDRQIAAGLELAGQQLATTTTKPSIAKPRYLVRGSSIRSTVRTKSSSTMLSLNVTHEPALLTPGHLGVSPIQPASGKDSDTSDTNDDHFSFHANNDTEEDENDNFTTPKSREPSRSNSPDTLRDIQTRGSMLRVVEGREDISETRSILEGLEHKLDALGNLQPMKEEEEDEGTFNKHTITELRLEMEAEMEKLRIEARERLEEERERYREEMTALKKEMDLERRNSQLRLEHAEKEVNRLHQENMDLNNQLRVVCNERRHGEESQMSLGSDRTDDSTNERFHMEYLSKIQQLMARLEDQDNQLITLKEDNVVLRNQKDHLIVALRGETNANKKRNFLGLSPNSSPRKDSSFTDLVLDDPGDIRIRIHGLHRQLAEQRDINGSLKSYLDTVLTNIMATNPELLEKIN